MSAPSASTEGGRTCIRMSIALCSSACSTPGPPSSSTFLRRSDSSRSTSITYGRTAQPAQRAGIPVRTTMCASSPVHKSHVRPFSVLWCGAEWLMRG